MSAPQVQDPTVQTLQEENRRLKRAVEELSMLNDLARAIGSSVETSSIMQTIIRRSLRAVNAEQGVITLVDEHALEPTKTLIRTVTSSSEHKHFHLNQSLLGWMLQNRKPFSSNDLDQDHRLRGVKWDSSITSVVCAPLMIKAELKGVLTLYNKKAAEGFTIEDQRILSIIAAQSAQVIENARLYEEEKKKLELEQQLLAARLVQESLLSREPPRIPGIDFAAMSLPAREVGGDVYYFMPTSADTLVFFLADVSGKGLPASLLAALGQGIFYAEASRSNSPRAILSDMNTILRRHIQRKSFLTMIAGLVDMRAHVLVLSSAGHCFPLHYSAAIATVTTEQLRGLALNLTDKFQVPEATFPLNPGDIFVFYTDGISEAERSDQEMFGEKRMCSILMDAASLSANEILSRILAEVNRFCVGREQSDDRTLVVLKVGESIFTK